MEERTGTHQGSLLGDAFSTTLPQTQPEVGGVHSGVGAALTATSPHGGRGAPLSQCAQVVTPCTVQHIYTTITTTTTTSTTTTTFTDKVGILGLLGGTRVGELTVSVC